MIITILRKSLEGSVADNVLKHGCGALNIDATRVEGCPVQRMDRQTGYGDEGGASRFFKQFKKEESNEP